MTEIQPRPFAGQLDLSAMIQLVRSRPAERADDFPGIADLEGWTTDSSPTRQIALWSSEEGRLDGYSIVDTNYRRLWLETTWTEENRGLEQAIIRWGEQVLYQAAQQVDEINHGSVEELSIRISCRDNFLDRIFLLETEGFEADTGYTVHLARDLSQPILKPQLPAGYAIRTLREDEVEAAVALHRAGFGTEYMTVEGRRSWMATTNYEPALDLVAVAPDGTLASYCFCNISKEDNELTGEQVGWTDPIATHPHHQRKGLAVALMCKGMVLLKERGMEKAVLGTWSENNAMWNAAEKVGYVVSAKTLFYSKMLK